MNLLIRKLAAVSKAEKLQVNAEPSQISQRCVSDPSTGQVEVQKRRATFQNRFQ